MKLKETIFLGVAGNFANHLSQAKELEDFRHIKTDEKDAPKGIFPFYLPNHDSFLGEYCIGGQTLMLPTGEANVHMEPEVGVLFEVMYSKMNKVQNLNATHFIAFNDCTIRREGAKKISHKKSWGKNSKGIGDNWIKIDKFRQNGIMDRYRICSFLKRDGQIHEYGVDAPLLGYSYFYEKLENWLIDKMNNQQDTGPLESIYRLLSGCDYPKQIFVSIGATAYADFGENNFLNDGDEIMVILYDQDRDSPNLDPSSSKSILHQKVLKREVLA